DDGSFRTVQAVNDRHMDALFRAAAESVEEAVLNSMTAADRVGDRRSMNEFLPECL
ncbi:MAG: P1 family peptidase, partial [Clostridia bacterium]|nr:P1 family peptidase [Clostridia bacterium]